MVQRKDTKHEQGTQEAAGHLALTELMAGLVPQPALAEMRDEMVGLSAVESITQASNVGTGTEGGTISFAQTEGDGQAPQAEFEDEGQPSDTASTEEGQAIDSPSADDQSQVSSIVEDETKGSPIVTDDVASSNMPHQENDGANGSSTPIDPGAININATQDNDNPDETYVYVDDVSINSPALSLVIGETAQLDATVTPADATNKAVSWSSSDVVIASDGRTAQTDLVAFVLVDTHQNLTNTI